ncbi:HNH endonuclease [Parachryseolinea silvisoli]|uniref:HNH endonuclease n=1 Tax=Parachryseolinea silvisoli TaxID=2873601 RepID=UPI002265E308|nr:HNH endonuclease [Parachryseolinea silvisoli]MCD9019157.1 HNH endonuclease [Parachryseolinea silvisoli]
MGKAKRKLHLFKLYRKNIELLCENPRYNRDVLKDIIICPICFHTFKESDIKRSGDKNYLTIEHVPPQYLGGRTEVLTCYKCNNLFSEFDKELVYVPHRQDSTVVNWRAKLKAGEDKFGAITEFDFNTNTIKFTLSNNDDLTKFIESFKGKNQFNFEVKDKTKAVGTNLLKIAYLLAFHKFGYGLIMQPQYNFIRAQIQSPYETILDNHGVVHFNDGLDLPDGVYVVKQPKEFVSLLVRFRLTKQDGTANVYSVHLPSPAVDVVGFYKRLSTIPKGVKYVVANFDDLDYWSDRTQAYAAIHEMNHYLQ